MNNKLSESLEDYLEAIAELIAVDGHAHTKEIAGKLNVKMPSVTGALRQLEQLGYIVYNIHYPVQLTSEGERVANEIVNRHKVLSKFFSEILGLPLEKASETACRLEHAVDHDTIERFTLFSEAIEQRDDAKKLQTYLTEAIQLISRDDYRDLELLSNLKPGTQAVIEFAGRNIPENERNYYPQAAKITVKSVSLDKTSFKALIDDCEINIPSEHAQNIWVKLAGTK